jgi:repressor LexA
MKDDFTSRLRTAMELRGLKQVDLTKRTGISKSTMSQYLSGKFMPKSHGIYKLALALNVNEAWLMGYDVDLKRDERTEYPDNIYKIEKRKVPLLGTIAAGEPIYAAEEHEICTVAGSELDADFCLKVKGDSMINARINDGDIVFIRTQESVDEGQIAAVIIDDEVTLKRVYKTNGNVMLVSENANYKPMVFKQEDGKEIGILGRAVAFQSPIF